MPADAPPAVQAEDVVVAFDGARVLDGVSLTVQPGEFVALLGSNGAGKTTLVRAILGLTELSSGSVHLDGIPLVDFRDWHNVALVPQRLPAAGAIPVSVDEVVAAGRTGPRPRLRTRSIDRAAVASALEQVGLTSRRKSRLENLSGGQQRRVLIARALATGAHTLFLDEPTAGVDAESQSRLAEVLRNFSRAGGTVLLVTHELGPLRPLVTRTVVLRDGRVIYDGPNPPADYLHDHVHHHSHDDPLHIEPGPLMES